ncbi:hypothetical protein EBQ34_14780 [Vandammella animalimorsus]|uniref:Uncharacterized protein n=1 Tax=Vandammella animalimorsus TaxID=2029117 RepID=A0A3M6QW69_9BURK|nr:hypothetical protein [Vandammella animalimorsus]RMX07266.1 hypothetical protein EBQ34_14780 [Vandammella animalimorsus]
MGLELVLVGAQLAIHRLGVEMLHPALGLMDLRALLGGAEQGMGIERHGRWQIHAAGVVELLEAGIQRHPGIGLALAGHMARAAAWVVLDQRLDPDMLKAKGHIHPAAGEDDIGHAALAVQGKCSSVS